MVAKVNRLSKYPLAQKEAFAAFEALKRTPEFFRRYLNRYLTYRVNRFADEHNAPTTMPCSRSPRAHLRPRTAKSGRILCSALGQARTRS
jgi:hypothetical protein